MSQAKKSFQIGRKQILVILLVAIGLYGFVPQLSGFQASLSLLRHPAGWPAAVGLGLLGCSYFAAAATYCLLAFSPLRYPRTVAVQLASVFANRLLPAGAGALGVNYLYLRKANHASAQAAAVVTANNLLGTLGHSSLFVIILLLAHKHVPTPKHSFTASHLYVAIGIGIVIIIGLLILRRRRQSAHGWQHFIRQLAQYRRRPGRVLAAFTSSALMTLTTIGCAWFCLQAVGVHLSFVVMFIVFSVGLSIGTATPTPGGLGGLEAGMVAGLVAYNVPRASALAGVILYRLLSYWLSLLVGAVAFVAVRREGWLKL